MSGIIKVGDMIPLVSPEVGNDKSIVSLAIIKSIMIPSLTVIEAEVSSVFGTVVGVLDDNGCNILMLDRYVDTQSKLSDEHRLADDLEKHNAVFIARRISLAICINTTYIAKLATGGNTDVVERRCNGVGRRRGDELVIGKYPGISLDTSDD